MADYGSASYWDERYAYSGDAQYDWYQSYDTLKLFLEPYLQDAKSRYENDFEILIPGCGSSTLGASLYEEGMENITNIDSSSVVISQMKEKYSHLEEMECSCEYLMKSVLISDHDQSIRSHSHGCLEHGIYS